MIILSSGGEKLLAYCAVLALYAPGALYLLRSPVAARLPIVTFYFFGLLLFNAIGSIGVLVREVTPSGVPVATAEFIGLLAIQAVVAYLFCGSYVIRRRGVQMHLSAANADRIVVLVLLVSMYALLALYLLDAKRVLLWELIVGNIGQHNILEYRLRYSYGLRYFPYYRIGLLVLPSIVAAYSLLQMLMARRASRFAMSVLVLCAIPPLILADKSGLLYLVAVGFAAYLLFSGASGRSIIRIFSVRTVLVGIAALAVTLSVYVVYDARDLFASRGAYDVTDLAMRVGRGIVYRIFVVHSEAMAAVVPFVSRYGELSGLTLPDFKGLLPHSRLIIEAPLHAFVNDPASVENALSGAFPGSLPASAMAEGYLNFGWGGAILFSTAACIAVLVIQELLLRIRAGLIAPALMAWYAFLAMTLSITGVFQTLASLIHTGVLMAILVLWWMCARMLDAVAKGRR